MDDTRGVKDDIPPISEDNWLTYFRSLHSKIPLNSIQQSIINELKLLEHHKEHFPSLDYLITENEIFIAARRLQNNKLKCEFCFKGNGLSNRYETWQAVSHLHVCSFDWLFNLKFLSRDPSTAKNNANLQSKTGY